MHSLKSWSPGDWARLAFFGLGVLTVGIKVGDSLCRWRMWGLIHKWNAEEDNKKNGR